MARFSTVMICPAALCAGANQLLDDMEGTGPNALSRPLYNGSGEITHYGFRASSFVDYRPLIAGILATTNWASYGLTLLQATELLEGAGFSAEVDGLRPAREHFDDVATALGLSDVPPE